MSLPEFDKNVSIWVPGDGKWWVGHRAKNRGRDGWHWETDDYLYEFEERDVTDWKYELPEGYKPITTPVEVCLEKKY
jgi:hypothetical protein